MTSRSPLMIVFMTAVAAIAGCHRPADTGADPRLGPHRGDRGPARRQGRRPAARGAARGGRRGQRRRRWSPASTRSMPSTGWRRRGRRWRQPTRSCGCCSRAAAPRTCAAPRTTSPRPRPSSTPRAATSTVSKDSPIAAARPRRRATTPAPGARSPTRAVAAARAELDKLIAGPRREEIEAARAQRAAATANVAAVEQQITDATVLAPRDGVITERIAEPGEVLPPGATLAVLTDIERPWLNVWIDEPSLSRVRLGDPVEVRVDGRDETFDGTVSFISPVAEFTPKNVQTPEERAKLVFRVKVDPRQPRRGLQAGHAGRRLVRRRRIPVSEAPLLAARDLVGPLRPTRGGAGAVARGPRRRGRGSDRSGRRRQDLDPAGPRRPAARHRRDRRGLRQGLLARPRGRSTTGSATSPSASPSTATSRWTRTSSSSPSCTASAAGASGARELLDLVGLAPFRDRIADRLSGGMKQKLALACTLIHSPEVLLLDEPTTGVDPVTRREFWRLLAELVGDGLTLVVATPYLDEAERCTRVVLMHDGRVLADRPPGGDPDAAAGGGRGGRRPRRAPPPGGARAPPGGRRRGGLRHHPARPARGRRRPGGDGPLGARSEAVSSSATSG